MVQLSTSRQKRIRQRTKALRRAISNMEYLASGTLHKRMKVCGRPNCRCAQDPSARHGPYYEWSRLEGRRLVHSILSKEQASWFKHAIENYRKVQKLLRLWERETAAEILERKEGRQS